jgi:hypothetical protein
MNSSQTNLRNWIDGITKAENPDKTIVAYYFGLFETHDGYTIYLVGSKEYDSEDDDWACNNDFSPSEKYLPLET